MSSRTLQIANGIRDTLDIASLWYATFTVGYRPTMRLEDLPESSNDWKVVIQPVQVTLAERLTRGGVANYDRQYVLEAVRRVESSTSDPDPGAIDTLVEQFESAIERLWATRLPANDPAVLTTVDYVELVDRDALDEHNAFFSRVLLTYRDVRP